MQRSRISAYGMIYPRTLLLMEWAEQQCSMWIQCAHISFPVLTDAERGPEKHESLRLFSGRLVGLTTRPMLQRNIILNRGGRPSI